MPTFTENVLFSVTFSSKTQTFSFKLDFCCCVSTQLILLSFSGGAGGHSAANCTFKAAIMRFLGPKAAAWSVNRLLRSNIWCVPAPQDGRCHPKPHQDGCEGIIHAVPSVAAAQFKPRWFLKVWVCLQAKVKPLQSPICYVITLKQSSHSASHNK